MTDEVITKNHISPEFHVSKIDLRYVQLAKNFGETF